MVPSA
jgi:Na+-driven multidrug efflux pump